MIHTKTFKIGEYAKGGIIAVEISGQASIKDIAIICKQWDFKAGYTRRSCQSKAQEIERGTIVSNNPYASYDLKAYICTLTTSYWADKIVQWIKTKIKIH